MTQEEKKAIEYIKSELQDEKEAREDYQSLTGLYGNLEIETILNLIQRQDTEINKLNNVIDKMAEVLNDFDYDKQCESCRTDICSASVDGTEYTKCIKEYFMKPEQN